ncbi:hypothetical protein EGH67_13420 [Klebsiella aerogenes]|nr:Hypothetical protein EAG7_00423 [Klebsiella aerogenes]CCG29045.1 hypothetical protein [Klebsiella aerogenes EA1509E]AYN07482.1 hypothetical protein AM441_27275 [Klebsiella aerogenes]AYY01044.1 hypothetical protein EGY11_13395 [Klebsiella aerogenes]PVF76004.1 hypothetical protein CSC18_1940 [Klebsiella aerogenes]
MWHKLKICLFVKGQHITVAAAFFPHFFATAQKRPATRVSSIKEASAGCVVVPVVVEYRPV